MIIIYVGVKLFVIIWEDGGVCKWVFKIMWIGCFLLFGIFVVKWGLLVIIVFILIRIVLCVWWYWWILVCVFLFVIYLFLLVIVVVFLFKFIVVLIVIKGCFVFM